MLESVLPKPMGNSTDRFLAKQILFWLVVILLFSASSCANNQPDGTLSHRPFISMPNGKQIVLVKIANDEVTRARGLSGVNQLAQNEGMWFEFDADGYYPFWMKDMKFNIDIIWVDGNYYVADIIRNAPVPQIDNAIRTYQNTKPARYVLEVNAGVSIGLSVGDHLVLSSDI